MCDLSTVNSFSVSCGDFQVVFPIKMLMYYVGVDTFRKLAVYSVFFNGTCNVFVVFASVFVVVFEVKTVFFCVFVVYVVAYSVKSRVILVCVCVVLFGVCVGSVVCVCIVV